MAEVLLINPNIIFPSDYSISGRSVQIRDLEKVVNLGLLSVASYLKEKGVDIKIIDLVGQSDDESLLADAILQQNPKLIGISCISCYAYPKLLDYAKLIKSLNSNIFILAGGQHLSGIPQIAMTESNHIDCIVKGEGEYISHQVYTRVKDGKSLENIPSILFKNNGHIIDNTSIPNEKIDLDRLPFLKYDIYPNFKEYSPHIEESRWCPFQCNFCTSGVMSDNIRYKSISRFVDEIAYVKSLYGNDTENLRFFFACSSFGLQKTRIEELIGLMREKKLNIRWRTETRCDAPMIDYIEDLIDIGLSVLDLGLESGSPTMLKLMNKCHHPEEYLASASRFIRSTRVSDKLLLKINLVFYAGETPVTVKETLQFLMEHSNDIDSISAGPVMIYAGVPMEKMIKHYKENFGTTVVHNDFWDKVHAFPVNPSSNFSFEQLNDLALIISKIFCSKRKYFEVKKYGQFPLSMTYDDFQQQISNIEENLLPFAIETNGHKKL